MLRNAKELEHYELRAIDGMIGRVHDFFFDDQEWKVRYLVVETGSWLERRKVLIAPAAVSLVEWDRRVLPVNLTQEQVRNSPGIDSEQPVSREQEMALAQYYNWPAYWGAAGFPDTGFGVPVMPLRDPGGSESAPSTAAATGVGRDQHLRSVRAVRGHTIEARDGRIGHAEDFLVDDRAWAVRYLVVDTRNWWPGKMVIVAPQWIQEVGWGEARVHLDLTRSAIKDSPPYDPMEPVTPDYAGQLHEFRGPPRHPTA